MSRSRQWSLTPGGGGGGATWGTITGTLSSQTDLQSALDAKAPTASPTLTGTAVLSDFTTDYTITAVNQGTKTFTLGAVNAAADFHPGATMSVVASTGNNGIYTVSNSAFVTPNTEITVVEAIPSAVADGRIDNQLGSAKALNGGLETHNVTANGAVKWRIYEDSGGGFNIIQDSGFGFQSVDWQFQPGTGNLVAKASGVIHDSSLAGSEGVLAFRDVTTHNASTGQHGLLPKLSGVSTQFLNGTGAWAVPAGGGVAHHFLSAYRATNQTLTAAVYTKVAFDTVSLDSGADFDTVNNRFVPGVAGKWRFTAWAYMQLVDAGSGIEICFYKNGVQVTRGRFGSVTGAGPIGPIGEVILDMNGTTDYVEVFILGGGATNGVVVGGSAFNGFLGQLYT